METRQEMTNIQTRRKWKMDVHNNPTAERKRETSKTNGNRIDVCTNRHANRRENSEKRGERQNQSEILGRHSGSDSNDTGTLANSNDGRLQRKSIEYKGLHNGKGSNRKRTTHIPKQKTSIMVT